MNDKNGETVDILLHGALSNEIVKKKQFKWDIFP